MATSDSDDFESADEEVEFRDVAPKKSPPTQQWVPSNSVIDSDSDDNVCNSPTVKHMSWSSEISDKKCKNQESQKKLIKDKSADEMEADESEKLTSKQSCELKKKSNLESKEPIKNIVDNQTKTAINIENKNVDNDDAVVVENKRVLNDSETTSLDNVKASSNASTDKRRVRGQQRPVKCGVARPAGLGAKKLGARMVLDTSNVQSTDNKNTESGETEARSIKKSSKFSEFKDNPIVDDERAKEIIERHFNLTNDKIFKSNRLLNKGIEIDPNYIPEELKSNKKFKEVFTNDWSLIDSEVNISYDKVKKTSDAAASTHVDEQLVSEATSNVDEEKTDSGSSWADWGSWTVTSLLNTATASVSTISSHVSQGLSMLQESASMTDAESEEKKDKEDGSKLQTEEPSKDPPEDPYMGFGSIFSGVSSLTKLVESTSTKVVSGGLSTLETIGKKTMEVLQEGDPGLKKKRAFLAKKISEKPNLSQILREAKEKADAEQRPIEEKELARKIHFESLFDDFMGLVHLEALEMLSKQSDMKIQQKLVALTLDQINSVQETLDEVKELCDLGDEDEEEGDESRDDNLNERLKSSCEELGVTTSFEKLCRIWDEAKKFISDASSEESKIADRTIFENAISTMAQFTAYCVERFHKIGELLLVKENRSTVTESDALVQITKILSGQIGAIASLYSKCLSKRIQISGKTDESVDVTTIFLEATNASSYINEAFRLFIPILQVGVI